MRYGDLVGWIDKQTGEIARHIKNDPHKMRRLKSMLSRKVSYIICDFDNEYGHSIPDSYDIECEVSEEIKKRKSYEHYGVDKKEEEGERRIEGDEGDGSSRDHVFLVEHLLLGEFKADKKANNNLGIIILYTKAIALYSNSKKLDFDTVFEGTMANQAFHAYHYSLFKSKDKQARWSQRKYGYDFGIVTNSLASFAEFVFMQKRRPHAQQYTQHLESGWRTRHIDDYSCAGALVILEHKINDIEPVERLLRESLKDWKTTAMAIKAGYYLDCRETKHLLRV